MRIDPKPVAVALGLAMTGCGGGSPTANPVPTPAATPTPVASTAPPATASQPPACQLTAPTVDCSTRAVRPQELAPVLQAAIDAAVGTPGVMYPEYANRIYDLERFRSRVVEQLAGENVCGAWDWGNHMADEIYVRSADGCVVEIYDLLSGDGGVRPATKSSNLGQEGWGFAVPAAKPRYPKDGDLSCSLEGDRSTFCFSIKNTPGAFGAEIYALLSDLLRQNPGGIFDSSDFMGGQGEFNPEVMRLPAWKIVDAGAYIAAIEKGLRARGFCAFVEKGDILKVKSVAKGNVFHEEFDIVQNPASGGSYTGFVIKDRCHNAGF